MSDGLTKARKQFLGAALLVIANPFIDANNWLPAPNQKADEPEARTAPSLKQSLRKTEVVFLLSWSSFNEHKDFLNDYAAKAGDELKFAEDGTLIPSERMRKELLETLEIRIESKASPGSESSKANTDLFERRAHEYAKIALAARIQDRHDISQKECHELWLKDVTKIMLLYPQLVYEAEKASSHLPASPPKTSMNGYRIEHGYQGCLSEDFVSRVIESYKNRPARPGLPS